MKGEKKMLRARVVSVCGSVFGLAVMLGALAYGQTSAGSILGTVTDDSGARVPGAAITVRNTETGITRSVTTDAGGRYRAPNLGLGLYEVRAELMGFRTAVRQGIQVTVAAESNVNLTLSIGAVAEQVVVTGEAPLIETTSATIGAGGRQKDSRPAAERTQFRATGVLADGSGAVSPRGAGDGPGRRHEVQRDGEPH